jgi:phosphoribosyl 1,2-cyclic phosphodiesterase
VISVTSLGSGSSGNAFVVQTQQTVLFLDCGVGIRTIKKAMSQTPLDGRDAGLIISHEHADHIRALRVFEQLPQVQVAGSNGTLDALGRESKWLGWPLQERHTLGDLAVTLIPVEHDAAEPCGFLIESPQTTIAVITDLGIETAPVREAIQEADLLVIESNYDEAMLQSSTYPAHLKRRIRGPLGHLGNQNCAELLAGGLTTKTRRVWLAHLSENNNRPGIAEETIRRALFNQLPANAIRALPRRDLQDLFAEPPDLIDPIQTALPLGR